MKSTLIVEFPMIINIPLRVFAPGQQIQFLAEGHIDEYGKLIVHQSRIIDMNKELSRCYVAENYGY